MVPTGGGGAHTRAHLRIVVGVLTFRREQMLAELLPLLDREIATLRQQLDVPHSARVLVVDNDPDRSARETVAAHAGDVHTYAWEPEPGISSARNRVLTESGDDHLLVFIDDDERPRPGWLAALVRTHLDSGAGLVAGPVESVFLGEPDPFVVAGGFFERAHTRGLTTGTPIARAATNNLLVDLAAVRERGLRFDPDFNRSGGEDGVFTGSLTRSGVRAVWCAEAVVEDLVPAQRLTRDYVLHRTVTLAQTSVLAELRLRDRATERARVRLVAAVKELVRLLLGVVRTGRGLLTGRLEDQARGRRAIARAQGSLRACQGRWPVSYGVEPRRTAQNSPRRVRVYQSVRSAHLERFRELEPATVYYVDRSYDFEEGLLEGLDVRRCRSLPELARRLARSRVDELEVNEPLMVPGLKIAVVAATVVRLRGALGRGRPRVVTYAIENADPFVGLADVLGRRLPAYRVLSRVLVRLLDRIAFGTSMAQEVYQPHLAGFRGTSTVVPALPTPCRHCPPSGLREARPPVVVFVGAFNERKGIRALLEAWPLVRERAPGARLLVLGKGPLEDLVTAACATDPTIDLTIDPTRDQIHAAFRGAKVATLLSTPYRGWREQVGLPVVEALSHGCEVVTTDQTGLASWLVAHGHGVVPPEQPALAADAVVEALGARRDPQHVLDALPDRDGRLEADRWMFAPERGSR